MANADPAHVSCAVGDADDKRFRVDGGVRPRERRDASVVAELERQQDAIASHLWVYLRFICGAGVHRLEPPVVGQAHSHDFPVTRLA